MSGIIGALLALVLSVPLVPSGRAMQFVVDDGRVFPQCLGLKNDAKARGMRRTENVVIFDVAVKQRVFGSVQSGAGRSLISVPRYGLVGVENASRRVPCNGLIPRERPVRARLDSLPMETSLPKAAALS